MSALYVHIPFCNHICYYCDFTKLVYQERLCNKYLDRLEKDLSDLTQDYETIYIGGGTPVSLHNDQLERLLSLLDDKARQVKEYTIECNPEVLDQEKLQILKKHHINRLSLGIQSFQDSLLKEIGRVHTGKQAMEIIKLAKDMGFDNISIDLMYGLPTQTLEDVKKDINIFFSLSLQHVSYYALIHEEKTIFAHRHMEEMDEDIEDEIYEYIDEALEKHGYHQYEISNYALREYQSMHNKKYWYYEDYDGVGVGAAGKKDHVLYEGKRTFQSYIDGKNIVVKHVLEKDEEMFEDVMMHLRLLEGIDERVFFERYQLVLSDVYQEAIDKHIQLGNLVYENHHYHCTKASLRYLNSILLDFL